MKRRKRRSIFPLIVLLLICVGIMLSALWLSVKKLSVDTDITQEVIGTLTNTEPDIPFSDLVVEETEVSPGFYYQSLTEDQKTVYKEIFQGVRDQQEFIYVHSPDSDEIGDVFHFLLYDHPELFWCTGEMQLINYDTYSTLRPSYTYQGEEWQQKKAEVESAAAACLAGVSMDAPEYDKVRYVYEYIIRTVDYNMEAPDNQNIYSALVNKASVCAGYSRAAQYLLQKLGIECIYAIGTIPQQGPHAWNIVKCNGQYYQMDVTFGDPVFQQDESSADIPADSVNYAYLCCTDDALYKNHTPDPVIVYPPCTSLDLNYYLLNGRYFDNYDGYTVLEGMNQSIYAMQPSFSCQFAGDEVYAQARDDLINNILPQAAQNLAAYYGLGTVWYTYLEDTDMNVFTVYWNYS